MKPYLFMVIGHSTWKNMYRSKYDKSTTASPTQKSQPEVTKTNWQRASLSQRPTNKELHGHKGTVISWLFFILWTWILLWLDFFSLFWWFLESDFFCLDDSSFSFYFSLSWWLLLLVLKVHLALIAPSCLYNPHHPSSISTSNKDLTHPHSNHQYQEQTISQPWASTLHSFMDFWTCCFCEYVNSVYQSICDSCNHQKCNSCEDIDIL